MLHNTHFAPLIVRQTTTEEYEDTELNTAPPSRRSSSGRSESALTTTRQRRPHGLSFYSAHHNGSLDVPTELPNIDFSTTHRFSKSNTLEDLNMDDFEIMNANSLQRGGDYSSDPDWGEAITSRKTDALYASANSRSALLKDIVSSSRTKNSFSHISELPSKEMMGRESDLDSFVDHFHLPSQPLFPQPRTATTPYPMNNLSHHYMYHKNGYYSNGQISHHPTLTLSLIHI
eukprot:TRINITY_DN11681_c0_g1_i1.p1 TRINITY_DN11681_c0_g1~~TRINITY_DN11681_c0_g1_i1.p1  ORF type:complete len:231 (-),score=14.43 TRINITY_DN11681_c0_g1_i1:20-712(-)